MQNAFIAYTQDSCYRTGADLGGRIHQLHNVGRVDIGSQCHALSSAEGTCAGDDTGRPRVGRCKLPACCIDCDNHPQQCPLMYSTCMHLANLSIIPSNKLVASPVVALLISGSIAFRHSFSIRRTPKHSRTYIQPTKSV